MGLIYMNDLDESLLKAFDNLESAKTLLKSGFEEGAVNRTYYAYFWVVRRLLLEKDILENPIRVRKQSLLNTILKRELFQKNTENILVD